MPVLAFHPLFTRGRGRAGLAAAPSAVLLVVPDRPSALDPAIVRRAAELAAAEDGAVTVVATVRIHGSALGAPHPGLLPTVREREQGRLAVSEAVAALEKLGARADGHIIVTRGAGRAIARAAKLRGARTVLVALPKSRGLRRLVEGDLAGQLQRRLRASATIEADSGRLVRTR